MKKEYLFVTAVILMIWLAGCGANARSVEKATAQGWLDSLPQGSPYVLTGQWNSPQEAGGGLGGHMSYTPMFLVQEGTKLRGTYSNIYEGKYTFRDGSPERKRILSSGQTTRIDIQSMVERVKRMSEEERRSIFRQLEAITADKESKG
jgi:hypothetical protein